ncbi:MAG: DUF4956 domain-containing protein [Verrucomicrobiales bacterium]|nr:DUF4956 domain-containing protein [Verrucomicrobiales bacterium]
MKASEWEVDSNGYWEALYSDDGREFRADFTKDGKWVETERSITFDDLPDAVKEGFRRDFGQEEIAEIEWVDNAVKGIFYDIELKKPGPNKDVEYNENGNRIEPFLAVVSEMTEPLGSGATRAMRTEEMSAVQLLFEFGFNLLTILIFAWAIYYRRHHDHKMLFLLLGFNLFLFPIFLLSTSLTIGFGFTVFALLALVRMRSDTFSKTEVAYLLGAVALTFINAILPARVEIASSIVVILAAYFADHPKIWRDGYRTTHIRYRIKDTTKMLDHNYLSRQLAEDFKIEVNNIEIERVAKNEVRMTVMYRADPAENPGEDSLRLPE